MEITLDELLRGKGTIIKNKEYLSTEAYVTPFLERISTFTNDFRVQVKLPDQVTLTKDNDIKLEDQTYNRVWIQGILPDELSYPNHKESISLLYALDTRKTVVKIFRSGVNMACLNLCVFDPSFLNIQALEPESAINFKCIKPLMEETSDIAVWLRKLEDTEVPYNEELINENLGQWIRNTIDNSYKKEDSPYYVKPGEITNMFNVYNAFTELISNDGTKENKQGGDIVNKAEKTLMLRDILQIV